MAQLSPFVGTPGTAVPVMVPRSGKTKVVPFAARVLPWALAAGLMIFCGVLGTLYALAREENRDLRHGLAAAGHTPASDLLATVNFCQLEPVAAGTPAQPRAVVAWDPAHHEGVLQIVQLTPPTKDKDYQLWTVEEGHQDAINAGLVHVDGSGHVQTFFKPAAADGGGRVLAFALSLEAAGGSPKNTGPIVLQGKL